MSTQTTQQYSRNLEKATAMSRGEQHEDNSPEEDPKRGEC